MSIRTFNGQWLIAGSGVATADDCCCDNTPGCTNPNSPNYDPGATCDDGSCETCCNQGLCVLEDPDCLGSCNSLTAPNGCNPAGTTEQEGPCVDCCDSYCQNGCPDEDPPQGAPNDCHSSFAASYVVTPEMDCDGVGFTYENCFDCEFVPPP